MDAKVVIQNVNRRMFAALTQDDEFAVFELLDIAEIELDDSISCEDFHLNGRVTIQNSSRQSDLKVNLHCVCKDSHQALQLCNY